MALITELGGPAVVVGNSMGAGSAVLAAAQRPDLVSGLVLVGPFVRNPAVGLVQRIALRAAMARPWAALSWKSYLPKLYAGARPADFAGYRGQVVAAWIAPALRAQVVMVPEAGHYPQSQQPDLTTAAVLRFLGHHVSSPPHPRRRITSVPVRCELSAEDSGLTESFVDHSTPNVPQSRNLPRSLFD